MEIETRTHKEHGGWDADLPGHLDSPDTLLLLFGDRQRADRDTVVDELNQAFPQASRIGCSGSGGILGEDVRDDVFDLAVVRFDHSRVRQAAASIDDPAASRTVGEALGRKLAGDDLRGVVVLSDGLQVNGTLLSEGLRHALPEGVPVSGGLAGDGDRFASTWVYDGAAVGPNRVSAIGLYGEELRFGHGSRGGWDSFGPERSITRSEGNVLYELDGQPALDLYKRYLGDRAAELPASALLFPLSIRHPDEGQHVVRTVLSIDDDANSMTFAGDLPEGWQAQLMRANFDRLIEGAGDAATAAGQLATEADSSDGPTLAIAVSCVGRRLVLRERCEEELEASVDGLPGGTSMIGFYSYGEISPCVGGSCELHNQTMTLTTIQEA